VRAGGNVRLRGEVRGTFSAGARARLMIREGARWVSLRQKPFGAGGTFFTNVRAGHRIRVLRIQAAVGGVGRSNVVRVRVRR
jgi:hypothetical protein